MLNRIRSADEAAAIEARLSLPVLGWLPDDDTIRRFDAEELSFFDMPSCPAREAVEAVLEQLAI